MPLPAELDDDSVLVSDRAHGIAKLDKGAAGKTLPKILRPHKLAGSPVQGVHFGNHADGVDIAPEEERRSVWSESFLHMHTRPEGGVVGVFPLCGARGRVDGDHDFLMPAPI